MPPVPGHTMSPDTEPARLSAEQLEIRSLLTMISHDLRAPLRSIDGFALALEEDYGEQLDEAGADFLRRIRNAAKRMDRMLVALVMLGRLSDRIPEADHADLSHAAEDVIVGLREKTPGPYPETHVDKGIACVTDRELVRVIFFELLSNAWKFTRGRPDARIEVRRESAPPGCVAFSVRDNGAGFDAAAAGDKLFGLFQRFHPEGEFAGEGAGLATARRAAIVLGGEIRAASEPDAGAVFRCVIPEARP